MSALAVALCAATAVVGAAAALGQLPRSAGRHVRTSLLRLREPRWGHRRRRARAATALPDAIDVLIGCLHAGMTPSLALDELSRRAPLATRPAWQAAVDRLHRGDGFADAIDELVRCCGPTAQPVVTVLSGGVRDGLPLLPLLDRLTIEADARRRRAAEAEARKLPVRLAFPLVCCTLPAFVLLAIVPALLGALAGLQLPT